MLQERGSREVRFRAQTALEEMTPANLFHCGISCDYAMECLAFLRECFDVDDPDPATTPSAVQAFCSRMKMLFCQGYILGQTSPRPAVPADQADLAAAVDPSPAKTVSQIVFEQVDFPEPSLGSLLNGWQSFVGK